TRKERRPYTRKANLRKLTWISLILTLAAAAPLAAGNNVWTTESPASVAGVSLLSLPRRPGTVFAAGGSNGVSRSDDSGRTWVPAHIGLPSQPISSIQADATGTTIFAVAVDAIYSSDDSGNSWERRVPLDPPGDAIMRAKIDPWNPDTVYAWGNYYCDF